MKLIVGGSGILGTAVATRLRATGEPVRVLSRHPERASSLAAQGVEVIRGDLLDRSSLERACAGAEVVIYTAHSLFGRGRTASRHVDGRGSQDLIDAAKSAGVRRFVYTSVFDMGPEYNDVPFIRIKYEVERYLKASELEYVIIRPTAFMEVHAHMLLGEAVLRKGKTIIFGGGAARRNYVAVDDVAQVVVRAVLDPALAGRTIDVAGPENLTPLEVVALYEQRAGRKARVRRVPLSVLRLMSLLLRPVHPGVSQALQMSVVSDRFPQTIEAAPPRDESGFEPTTLSAWLAGQPMPG
jgi:uncharacterized protein YbjT (DUF2867 family)